MREIDHSAHPEQNVPAPDTTSRPAPTGVQPQTPDRRATVLYLETVRNLEATKHWLQHQANEEPRRLNQEIEKVQVPNYTEVPKTPEATPLLCVICGVAASLVFAAALPSPITIILAVTIILLSVGYALFYIRERKETKSRQNAAIAANADEDKRIALAVERLRQESDKKLHQYEGEIKSAEKQLKNFYSMNIIPLQYRNLASVCYIYDYMSTSQQSLTSALFDYHIEDGIQRIEGRLSEVCARIVSEIRYAAMGMIAQNTQMLSSLQRTAANTENAAFYARLGSYYAQANTYYNELYH